MLTEIIRYRLEIDFKHDWYYENGEKEKAMKDRDKLNCMKAILYEVKELIEDGKVIELKEQRLQ